MDADARLATLAEARELLVEHERTLRGLPYCRCIPCALARTVPALAEALNTAREALNACGNDLCSYPSHRVATMATVELACRDASDLLVRINQPENKS